MTLPIVIYCILSYFLCGITIGFIIDREFLDDDEFLLFLVLVSPVSFPFVIAAGIAYSLTNVGKWISRKTKGPIEPIKFCEHGIPEPHPCHRCTIRNIDQDTAVASAINPILYQPYKK